jgi:hypothetical protein
MRDRQQANSSRRVSSSPSHQIKSTLNLFCVQRSLGPHREAKRLESLLVAHCPE